MESQLQEELGPAQQKSHQKKADLYLSVHRLVKKKNRHWAAEKWKLGVTHWRQQEWALRKHKEQEDNRTQTEQEQNKIQNKQEENSTTKQVENKHCEARETEGK